MYDKTIEKAYQDAAESIDMLTAVLQDLRDSLQEMREQFETPVRKSEKQED